MEGDLGDDACCQRCGQPFRSGINDGCGAPFITPCGHALCVTCLQLSTLSRCPICPTRIDRKSYLRFLEFVQSPVQQTRSRVNSGDAERDKIAQVDSRTTLAVLQNVHREVRNFLDHQPQNLHTDLREQARLLGYLIQAKKVAQVQQACMLNALESYAGNPGIRPEGEEEIHEQPAKKSEREDDDTSSIASYVTTSEGEGNGALDRPPTCPSPPRLNTISLPTTSQTELIVYPESPASAMYHATDLEAAPSLYLAHISQTGQSVTSARAIPNGSFLLETSLPEDSTPIDPFALAHMTPSDALPTTLSPLVYPRLFTSPTHIVQPDIVEWSPRDRLQSSVVLPAANPNAPLASFRTGARAAADEEEEERLEEITSWLAAVDVAHVGLEWGENEGTMLWQESLDMEPGEVSAPEGAYMAQMDDSESTATRPASEAGETSRNPVVRGSDDVSTPGTPLVNNAQGWRKTLTDLVNILLFGGT